MTKNTWIALMKNQTFAAVIVLLIGAGVVVTNKETIFKTINTATSTVQVSSSSPNTENKGKCFVGGCSGQVCSDKEGIVSNCMYKEEYACYKKTKCERQANGACGWTETQEFKICLSSSVKIQQ